MWKIGKKCISAAPCNCMQECGQGSEDRVYFPSPFPPSLLSPVERVRNRGREGGWGGGGRGAPPRDGEMDREETPPDPRLQMWLKDGEEGEGGGEGPPEWQPRHSYVGGEARNKGETIALCKVAYAISRALPLEGEKERGKSVYPFLSVKLGTWRSAIFSSVHFYRYLEYNIPLLRRGRREKEKKLFIFYCFYRC